MVRCVFFDLDETLVDQQAGADRAVEQWARARGVDGDDVVERWARIADDHFTRYQHRELTFTGQRRARVREFLGLNVDDDQADLLFADYLARYEAGWKVFPDAPPALARARAAGWTVAVLSNGDLGQQRLKVERLGLAEAIDLLICSSELPAGKPDPRAFEAALRRAKVPSDQALMVGDSLLNDVLAALDAGLDAVLLDRDGRHQHAPVRRIESLDELEFSPAR